MSQRWRGRVARVGSRPREHRSPHHRQGKLPLGVDPPQEREGLLPRDSRMTGPVLVPSRGRHVVGPRRGVAIRFAASLTPRPRKQGPKEETAFKKRNQQMMPRLNVYKVLAL